MSDFSTLDLLIESMDSSLDGPLSSREVECVAKGWRQGEATANAEITRLQAELDAAKRGWDYYQDLVKSHGFEGITRLLSSRQAVQADNEALRARVAELEECADAVVYADSPGNEWERIKILKETLDCSQSKAWLLRKQAEAVEEIVDADPDGRSEDGGALVAMDTIWDYAQDLRTQAAALERQSVEGGE